MARKKALRMFWKEILPGDLLKLRAESNVSPSGGGARDLRFPDRPFRPLLSRMFPNPGRSGRQDILVGTLVSEDPSGKQVQFEVEYWPPTDARPTEGRLARIHSLPPLQGPPDPGESRLVLMLVQDESGAVRAHYATEQELGSGRWHSDVARPILRCLGQTREGRAAVGYIDFKSGDEYCHD